MVAEELQDLMEESLTPPESDLTLPAVERQERPRFERKKRPVVQAPTRKPMMTFREYKEGLWPTWRKDGIKASTRYGQESMWKRHIEPELGSMKLVEIGPCLCFPSPILVRFSAFGAY